MLCAIALFACAGKELPAAKPEGLAAAPVAPAPAPPAKVPQPAAPQPVAKPKPKPKTADSVKEQREQFQPYRKKNTAKAYYAFMKKYPKNRWVAEARLYADELEFAPHAAVGTADAYSDFIQRYPDNRFAGTAKAALDDLNFEKVKEADTIIGYAEYMKEYPTSPRLAEARWRRDSLEYAPFKTADTLEALNEFINAYPLSPFREEAEARAAELDSFRVQEETAKICNEYRHTGGKYGCVFVSFETGTLMVAMQRPTEAQEGQKYLMGGPGFVEEMERRYKEWENETLEKLATIHGVTAVEERDTATPETPEPDVAEPTE